MKKKDIKPGMHVMYKDDVEQYGVVLKVDPYNDYIKIKPDNEAVDKTTVHYSQLWKT